jgi:hypothetical protein
VRKLSHRPKILFDRFGSDSANPSYNPR